MAGVGVVELAGLGRPVLSSAWIHEVNGNDQWQGRMQIAQIYEVVSAQ